jgi:hypothetical protein
MARRGGAAAARSGRGWDLERLQWSMARRESGVVGFWRWGLRLTGAEPRGLARLVRATRSTKCSVEDDRQTRWDEMEMFSAGTLQVLLFSNMCRRALGPISAKRTVSIGKTRTEQRWPNPHFCRVSYSQFCRGSIQIRA